MEPVVKRCPKCGRELIIDNYKYDDDGVIAPLMVFCDRLDRPCDGAFIFRGRIETTITTTITPIPSLDVALRMNGIIKRAKTIVNFPLIEEIKEKKHEASEAARKG